MSYTCKRQMPLARALKAGNLFKLSQGLRGSLFDLDLNDYHDFN
jgi:hypothetical protein